METPCLEALIGMFGLYMDQDYFSRGRRWNSWTCPGTGKASGGRTDVRPPLQLVENPLPREASQSSVACRRRNEIKSVISEDMSLGNDTSMAGGATISKEIESRTPCSPLLEKKALVPFSRKSNGGRTDVRPPLALFLSLRSMVK